MLKGVKTSAVSANKPQKSLGIKRHRNFISNMIIEPSKHEGLFLNVCFLTHNNFRMKKLKNV